MLAKTERTRAGILDLPFDNRYQRLGPDFHTPVRPTPLDDSFLIHANPDAARLLGLSPDELADAAFEALVSGRGLPAGADPVAMLYAGHQFGHYVPQLGDGRAILLGQVRNPSGQSWDLQLKGAGLTAYSRDGDGRAVLRSSIREYLCSEAMHGLGIPTTRALALVGSGEEVYRERIERGAMLTRIAPSHVRFGSFEVFYYRSRFEELRLLADHVIDEHYRWLRDAANPYLAFLDEVIERSADLAAHWQSVGFAHGVLNTDNMSVLGLTLDYGPFGFLDVFDAGFICNHSDHHGRYAFGRQPGIVLWNLSCLAQALLPLLGTVPETCAELARASLDRYETLYRAAFQRRMADKLGLRGTRDGDWELISALFDTMQGNQVDYTLFFRRLADFSSRAGERPVLRDHFIDRDAFDAWAERYRERLCAEPGDDQQRRALMRQVNPAVVLRNYLAQVAIEKAEQGDYSEIDRLLTVLRDPFDTRLDDSPDARRPPAWADQISVSCSS